MIIGAQRGSPGGRNGAGKSYVIFNASFTASFDLAILNGSNGFRLDGIDAFDRSGTAVSKAGDVNRDGFDDLLISATGADPGGHSEAGESYVIFASR